MKKALRRSIDTFSLRRRAEEALKKTLAEEDLPRMEVDVHRQLHELQVHQIELEMQNQALFEFQQAMKDVEEGLVRYTELYDFAPVGYFTLDRCGVLCEANLTGASLLGLVRARLIGHRLGMFVSPECLSIFDNFLETVFKGSAEESCELSLVTLGRPSFRVRITANADASGRTCRAVVTDITAHHEREEVERFAAAVLNTVGEGVIVTSLNKLIISVNPAFSAITGYAADQVVGKNLRLFFSGPQQPEFYRELWETLINTASWQGEIWNRHQDGTLYVSWLSLRLVRDDKGNHSHYVGIFSDITKRKLAERMLREAHDELEVKVQERTAALVSANALLKTEIEERTRIEDALRRSETMLRELAIHQERIKEEERKRIAREIHDDLGQNLLTMRIDVSMLHARTADTHPRLNAKVNDTLKHIDHTMKSLKAIINDLRPSVLDLGLASAMEWHVQEFERRTGISCELEMFGDELELEDERTTVLFRILQEALVNVSRHAQASHIHMVLQRTASDISIKIADNGIGITLDGQEKSGSFGLMGMRERIHALGGELTIDGEPGSGTTIIVSIPLSCPGCFSKTWDEAQIGSSCGKLSSAESA